MQQQDPPKTKQQYKRLARLYWIVRSRQVREKNARHATYKGHHYRQSEADRHEVWQHITANHSMVCSKLSLASVLDGLSNSKHRHQLPQSVEGGGGSADRRQQTTLAAKSSRCNLFHINQLITMCCYMVHRLQLIFFISASQCTGLTPKFITLCQNAKTSTARDMPHGECWAWNSIIQYNLSVLNKKHRKQRTTYFLCDHCS